jgi:hypothetical protein
MAGGTVAVICWLDWIQRNLPETLGDDYSDADSRTAALLSALNEKPAAKFLGAGSREVRQRASALKTTRSHNRPQSHFRTLVK